MCFFLSDSKTAATKMSPKFDNKFIAYVDMLGFKSKVEAAERSEQATLSELLGYCADLRQSEHVNRIKSGHPSCCPDSPRNSQDLSYKATQVSDCIVISTEISPAGIVNLLFHIYEAACLLVKKGVLVRGYVCQGSIFHEGRQFMGTGYQRALSMESQVKAFRLPEDETFRPPFVEIAPGVVNYIREADSCVQKCFERFCKNDQEGVTAIFPVSDVFGRHAEMSTTHAAPGNSLQTIFRAVIDELEDYKRSLCESLSLLSLDNQSGAGRKTELYKQLIDGEIKDMSGVVHLIDDAEGRGLRVGEVFDMRSSTRPTPYQRDTRPRGPR